MGLERWRQPEGRFRSKSVQDWTNAGDQTMAFGPQQDSSDANERQPEPLRCLPGSHFIDQNGVGVQLYCQGEGFGFARVEIGGQPATSGGTAVMAVVFTQAGNASPWKRAWA